LAHRSVTTALRSKGGLFEFARHVWVIDADATVRWSLHLGEEGRPMPDDARTALEGPAKSGTVVRALGGMECAGCHPAHAMDVGQVVVAMDHPQLQAEVQSVVGRALVSLFVLGSLLIAAAAL